MLNFVQGQFAGRETAFHSRTSAELGLHHDSSLPGSAKLSLLARNPSYRSLSLFTHSTHVVLTVSREAPWRMLYLLQSAYCYVQSRHRDEKSRNLFILCLWISDRSRQRLASCMLITADSLCRERKTPIKLWRSVFRSGTCAKDIYWACSRDWTIN